MNQLNIADLENSLNDMFASGQDLLADLDQPDQPNDKEGWHILIVDDEPEIHAVTKLALGALNFEDKPIFFTSAFSATEAKKYLHNDPGYAMVLLDVVMESEHAGLELVNYIRHELQNKYLRIVLRTGQPGIAPEDEIIKKYDIDDYKAKTELTAQKLNTVVISALRAYRELMRIDKIVHERTAEVNELYEKLSDSIVAAQRIQTAILPAVDFVSKYLPNFVVYYMPKDIVSGDFYWFNQFGGKSFLANVDCSGHGVPGALLSMFGYNLLNHIVEHEQIFEPHQILKTLDQRLKEYLNKNQETHSKYSMDMSVLVIDHENKTVSLSCAKHSIFLLINRQLIEITGDKEQVGDTGDEQFNFTLHELEMQSDDKIYLFTDGITDQFGGDNGKKYSIKRLREFLDQIKNMPLEQQMGELTREFEGWRRDHPQTDDISFIGIQPFN